MTQDHFALMRKTGVKEMEMEQDRQPPGRGGGEPPSGSLRWGGKAEEGASSRVCVGG